MAVRCIAQRFERAVLSSLPTDQSTSRCLTTYAERSVPELAAIFEAGAGGDADAFLRRLRGRNAHSPAPGPVKLVVMKHTAEKERRVEPLALPKPAILRRDLVKLASPDASLLTPSLASPTALKQRPVSTTTCSTASVDDDEDSVASSHSTESVSDDESGPDDSLQADWESKQPVEDFLTVEPTFELIIDASDQETLATNKPVLEVVESMAETTVPTQVLISDAAASHDTLAMSELAALKTLESTIVTTTTTTTKTLTATAPVTSSPSPASSRSRVSSRPRLDQKLQPPSVLTSRSPPSSSTPSSTPARECTRSPVVAATRAPVAAPTPISTPQRDVSSRYMNFTHSDRFLEERQRNVARRQELAARSQQNAQIRLNAGARSTSTSTATSSASSATRAVASRLTAFENDPRWLSQVAENRARADRVRAARKTKATATVSA